MVGESKDEPLVDLANPHSVRIGGFSCAIRRIHASAMSRVLGANR